MNQQYYIVLCCTDVHILFQRNIFPWGETDTDTWLSVFFCQEQTAFKISTEKFVAITFPFEECNERKNVCAFKAVKTTLIKIKKN